ncbi:MAG TPA: DedA family protein [Steroidobacteraceae bacterium]|nr:DedA family protein [Steroidobacteraceae bacterium]
MSTIYSAGYAGLVFLMFLENVFPPIPSELIMPLAGFMATSGKLSLPGVVIAGTIGSVLGALPPYYLARRFGAERLERFADRHGRWLTLSRRDLVRARRWFDRHGAAAVFFCRLIPGLRSLISLPAGIDRMNVGAFLFWTTLGAALWTGILAGLGYVLGRNFKVVEQWLDPFSWVVLGTILVLYVWRVIRHKGAKS